jgi:hypothetical protein
VLISQVVYEALGDALLAGVTFRDLGTHHLKGLPEPEHLFQLVTAGVRNDFPALRSGAENTPTPEPPGRTRELAGSLRRAVTALQTRSRMKTLESEQVAQTVKELWPSQRSPRS